MTARRVAPPASTRRKPAPRVKRKAPALPPQKRKPAKPIKSERARPPHPGEIERIAERRRQVFALRRIGLSYPEIANKVGCSTTTAWEDVQTELTERIKQNSVDAEALRTMELERCDAVMTAMWPKVKNGDDKAANAYLRAMNRRAALLGLDAPQKIAPTDPTGLKPYPVDLNALPHDILMKAREAAALVQKARQEPKG